MDCSQHSPSRIIPHRGQVTEDFVESAIRERRRVFHDDEARSHFAHDSPHFAPESASLAIESGTRSSDADVLAREAASDDVHQATPRPTIKCSHVVPNREGWQASVVLPGHEDTAGVVVDFDGAHSAESAEDAAEYSASMACEKCQLIE
jgi:hypothetical protein